MSQGFSETLGSQGFALGVVSATDPTLTPANASPAALNSALFYSGADEPYVGKRPGCQMRNDIAFVPKSGSTVPSVLGIYDYAKVAGTRYVVVTTDDGSLQKLNSDDTTTVISTSLTAGTKYPDFETASDYLFVVNGTDAKKWDGTTVSKFGITRPVVGSLSAAAGSGTGPTGTYDLRITYYNSTSGHESSASDTAAATVTLANQKMTWSNIPDPTGIDAQIDTVYLYVRNTATMPAWMRAGSVAAGTTSLANLNFTDAGLTILAPTTGSNDPPPAGTKFLCYHQGRMFAATTNALYWSKVGDVESFDLLNATDPVQPGDGQTFTGLHSDHEILAIFKQDKTFGLYGVDPDTWEIRLISSDIGCGSHRTILSANQSTYWWSRHGFVAWDGTKIDQLGQRTLGDADNFVTYSAIASASAGYDHLNSRVIMAVPSGLSSTRADTLLPWNVNLGILESSGWDPMDAACLGTIQDSNGNPRCYLGNYNGQLFTVGQSTNDGVPDGAASLTIYAKSTKGGAAISATSFNQFEATLHVTGQKLLWRKVTVFDSTGKNVTPTPRPYITAITTYGGGLTPGTINISSAISGVIAGGSYTMLIGGPFWQFDTPWMTNGTPWQKKRFEFLMLLLKGGSFGSGCGVDVDFDYDASNINPRATTIVATTGTWGTAVWGVDVWGQTDSIRRRLRMARTGFAWRARFRNPQPDQPVALLKVGMVGVTQTTKR